LRALFLFLLVALIGCAKPPITKKVTIEDDPQDDPGQVRKALKDAYAAIEALESDRIEKLLAPDVVAFGLGPTDFFTASAPLLEHFHQELIPFGLRGDALKVVSSKPRIGIGEGGKSAWLDDLPRIERIRSGKASQFWAPRITAHLVRDGAAWKFDAIHVSFGFPDPELYAAGSEKKLVAPEDPQMSKGPDSEQLVGLTRRMLDDIAVKIDRLSDSESVALFGTDPTDTFEGGKAFKDLVRPQLAQLKKNNTFSYKLEGGPRSRLAPGGKTGWVAATVILRMGDAKKGRNLVPFRALWIYAEEKGVWNLVSDHQSLGLKPDQRAPSEKPEAQLSRPDGGSL
jgi:ketosteroid isomerase-like protein